MFQLTTSRRGRQLIISFALMYLPFQLTTSRRGRLSAPSISLAASLCFNSRPHEEVDVSPLFAISIAFFVSTHDLTKRSTIDNSFPLSICTMFQLTTSRRGRHIMHKNIHVHLYVSTHDLTKRSTQ